MAAVAGVAAMEAAVLEEAVVPEVYLMSGAYVVARSATQCRCIRRRTESFPKHMRT